MAKKNDSKTESKQVNISQSLKDGLLDWLITLMQRRRNLEQTEREFTADVNKMPSYIRPHYLKYMAEEQARVALEWIEAQHSAKGRIKDIFKSIKSKKSVSISTLQEICRAFLDAYVTAARQVYPEMRLVWLDEADCKILADTAVAVYLERWIENDEELYENMRSFAAHGLLQYKTEMKTEDDQSQKKENDYLSPWRAYAKKYVELFKLREKQAMEENTEAAKESDMTKNQRPLDLITLTWCSAWSEGYLSILDALVFQKQLLNRKSKRNVQQNETMATKLAKYRQFLQDIEKCYSTLQAERGKNDSEKKDFSTAVAYTAYCILLQKIERSAHVQLAVDMAHYTLAYNVEIDGTEPSIATAYWGRYTEQGETLFDSAKCLEDPKLVQRTVEQCAKSDPIIIPDFGEIKRKYSRINEPLNVLNHHKSLDAMYHTRQEYVEDVFLEEIMRRRALMDLLTLIYMVFPVHRRKHWTDQDFIDAADFYHYDYPIVQTYLNTPIPFDFTGPEKEKTNCFYDQFYEFYLNLCRMDDSPLRNAVDFLTDNK